MGQTVLPLAKFSLPTAVAPPSLQESFAIRSSLSESRFGIYLTMEIWVKVLNSTIVRNLRFLNPRIKKTATTKKKLPLFTPSPLFFLFS